MLFHYCFENDVDIKVVHLQLYNSILKIWVHHTPQASKMDEGLKNLKLSAKGSIRKMANVIQITQMVKNLCEHGLSDFGAFVRKWNQMSGRTHQIVGRRAMSLKLLFENTPEDLQPRNHFHTSPSITQPKSPLHVHDVVFPPIARAHVFSPWWLDSIIPLSPLSALHNQYLAFLTHVPNCVNTFWT